MLRSPPGHYVRIRHGHTTARGVEIPVTGLEGPFENLPQAADYIAKIFPSRDQVAAEAPEFVWIHGPLKV